MLRRFLFQISNISPDWKIENVLEEELEKIRRIVSISFPTSHIRFLESHSHETNQIRIVTIFAIVSSISHKKLEGSRVQRMQGFEPCIRSDSYVILLHICRTM